MNDAALLREMTADLQAAPAGRVIYLEGKTDVPIFFALLGVVAPRDSIHQGVLVRGLRDDNRGAGGDAVRARTSLAARTVGYSGIYGITDGDGRSVSTLAGLFDTPYAGPCFTWKAYCIENLLAKACWPQSWGSAPTWRDVLLDHVPYVALNRMHRELLRSLETLRLAKYVRPTLEEPLRTKQDVLAALAKDKHLVAGYDVEARFAQETSAIESAITTDVDEGHALVNGKWLVEVFAPRKLGAPWDRQRCREEWTATAAASPGLTEVRDLWQRITGRLP
jgi:hypothetical protein